MGIIILVFVLGLSMALPVKCYNDGQYKIKCLEMHGTLTESASEWFCETRAQEREK